MKQLFKYSVVMMIIFPINLSFGMEYRRQNDNKDSASDRAIKMEKLERFHRLQIERIKYFSTIINLISSKKTQPLQKLAILDTVTNKKASTTVIGKGNSTFVTNDIGLWRKLVINSHLIDFCRYRLTRVYLANLAQYILNTPLSDEKFNEEFANFMAELNQAHLNAAEDVQEIVKAYNPDGFFHLHEFVLLHATRMIFEDEQLKKDLWMAADVHQFFALMVKTPSGPGEKNLYEHLHTTNDSQLKYFAFSYRSTIKHNTLTVAHTFREHYNDLVTHHTIFNTVDESPALEMTQTFQKFIEQLKKPVTQVEVLTTLRTLNSDAEKEFVLNPDPGRANYLSYAGQSPSENRHVPKKKFKLQKNDEPQQKKKKKRKGKKNRKPSVTKRQIARKSKSKKPFHEVLDHNANVVDDVLPTVKPPLEIPCEVSDENLSEESTSTSTSTTSVEEQEDAVADHTEMVVYEKKYRGCNREYKKKLKDARDEKRNKNKEKKKSKKKIFNKPERKFLKKIVFAPKTSWKKYNWKKVSKMLVKAGWKVSNSTGSSAVHLTPRENLQSVIGAHTISIDAPHDTSETPMPGYVVNHLKTAFKKKYNVDEMDLQKKSKK